MCLRVAMLSMHTSPLAPLGQTRDAGGMNVYIRDLARELGRGGLFVDIFTRRADPAIPAIQHLSERVRLVHIPAGPTAPLAPSALYPYVDQFERHIARFAARDGCGYDLIHSHYWLSALAGMRLARAWDVPHVMMYHTVERLKAQHAGRAADGATSPASALRMEHEGHIAAAADRITVSTTHEAEQLRRAYGVPEARLRIIPCGVDLRRFSPGGEGARAAARQALGLGDLPALLFVGRLDPIKGLDLLLESVATMSLPAQLIVVGGNPRGDAEVDRLRERARALGLDRRVRFPGAVAQERLPVYYRAADALVVTSHYESFGLVAVEALACGTPVVAAQVGGLPSIIRHGVNGLLVPWRCPRAFAEQLDLLLGTAALRAQLRMGARRSVERFDWRRIGDRVRQVYRELAAAPQGVAACSCF